MKRILALTLFVITSSGCKSYFDNKGNSDEITIHNMNYKFHATFNTLTVTDGLPNKADNIIKYPQNFSIDLPKKIKSLSFLGTSFINEFESSQLIIVDAGYVSTDFKCSTWNLIEPNYDDIIFLYIRDDWDRKKYFKIIRDNPPSDRTTKIYTNGKVKILLFNIKNGNFDKYLDLVKNFRYLN